MINRKRLQIAASALLVSLAGTLLALAWWDWAYPGQVARWAQGESVYCFFWRQLGWALAISEAVCLSLWAFSASISGDWKRGLVPAARPFLLAYLVSPVFLRYTFHPVGVQSGSSVWAYGLTAVTAGVLSFPLAKIVELVWRPAFLRRRADTIVYVLVALYALTFGLLSSAQHMSFRTHALDLGTMDQAAWNTVQGRVLEKTPLYRHPAEGSRYENRLLDAKLELIFIPLSALYALWPDPRALLIVQTLFLAAGGISLFRLVGQRDPDARDAPESERGRYALLGVLLAAAYLVYFPLHYVNMADFHPSALMIPFLIAAWRAVVLGRWNRYYLWLALALCCRIDAAFVALALGAAIAGWQKGKRRHGLFTVCLAVAWLALDFGVVVPAVRQVYGPGAGNLVSRRFGALGSDLAEAVRTLITRPGFVLTQFADRDKLQAIVDLVAPPGLTPLLSPVALLPALPVLAINLLAESSWQSSVHAHYMAPVIPFVWIAVGEGVARLAAGPTAAQRDRAPDRAQTPTGDRLRKAIYALLSCLARGKGPRAAITLSTFILLHSALTSYVLSPFPPGKTFRLADFYQPSTYEQDLRAVLALIPEGASVCAQSDLHPHLSQRQDACLFPRCRLSDEEEAEYVLVDLDPTSIKSPLDYHTFYQLVDAWLDREEYGVIAQRGSALLLGRGASRESLPDVLSDIEEYGQGFYRVEYLKAAVPTHLRAEQVFRIPLEVRNTGSQCWASRDRLPVRLTYRWWTTEGTPLYVEALRTDLPHRVEPGHKAQLHAWLLTPSQPGEYVLEWDLVREGDAWFSQMGASTSRHTVAVQPGR
ncbi:MAG: DUF2079 domain-containing protein [Anaerolineae bacterium]|nr:DUF2079 domain-containing protein [Anaerolineae bacterium]